jgi:hypothetical protein
MDKVKKIYTSLHPFVAFFSLNPNTVFSTLSMFSTVHITYNNWRVAVDTNTIGELRVKVADLPHT